MTGEPLPRYVQISEQLIRDIAAGRLADGARLPPERRMAGEFGVSVGTLRKALERLAEGGLLTRIQGSGNYVNSKASVPSVYAMFRLERLDGGGLPTADVLSVSRQAKPADLPDFGAEPEAFRIRRLRRLDGDPVALEEIWLDGSWARTLTAKDLSESLYLHYRAVLGLEIGRVEDRIGLGEVPPWRPDLFRPAAGAPAPLVERLSWAHTGQTAEFSRTWFDNEKARYISRLGKG